MYVKFWGTRGSIPASISSPSVSNKIRQALEGAAGLDLTDEATLERYLDRLPFVVQSTMGGNTPCLEIRSGGQILIIDAGSGLRLLGLDLMERGFLQGNQRADILMTHTHWDHIQGFPFFRPAFIPTNHLVFHSPFDDLKERLNKQQQPTFFPVPLSHMRAKFEFEQLTENRWYRLGNFNIYPVKLSHPGSAYGYRIEDGQSCLVCAFDAAYERLDAAGTESYVEFFRQADLVIFDAQYSLTEALDRPDWGHSSAIMGAELAFRAGVRRLALFHHDPSSSDEQIWAGKEQAEAYLMRRQPGSSGCEVIAAYDGLSFKI